MHILVTFSAMCAVLYWAVFFASSSLDLTVEGREVLAIAISVFVLPVYIWEQQVRKAFSAGWLLWGLLSVWMGLIYFFILTPLFEGSNFPRTSLHGFFIVWSMALIIMGACTRMLHEIQSRSFPVMMFFVWNFYGVAVVCSATFLAWLMVGVGKAHEDVISVLFPLAIILSLVVASGLHFLVKSKRFRDFHLNKKIFK